LGNLGEAFPGQKSNLRYELAKPELYNLCQTQTELFTGKLEP